MNLSITGCHGDVDLLADVASSHDTSEQDEILISGIRTGTIHYRGKSLSPDLVESVMQAIGTTTE